MANYAPGSVVAGEALSRDRYTDAEIQRLLQALMLSKALEQRHATAQPIAGDIMTSPAFTSPQGPQPQPPPPGASSPPMMGAPTGPPPGAPPMAPPGGGMPPPMMGAPPPQMPFVTQPPGGPPGAPRPPMAADSWKSMPTPDGQPGAAPPAPGMPPTPPKQDDSILPRRLLSVADIGKMLAEKGIKGQAAFDVMESLQPHMDSENRAQLRQMQTENSALHAAVSAYQRSLQLAETEREHRDQDADRALRRKQSDERIQLQKDRLKAATAKAAGGGGNLKNVEYIYPKGADGLPDESQPPIGTRGTTKSGKIIALDAEGNVKSSSELGGGTAKEGAHVGAKEKAKTSADRMETNSLISEYRALSQNLTRKPEDNKRMDEIAKVLRERKVNIPGGEGGKADNAKLAAQAHEAISAGKDEAQVRARYKAMTGEDLK